LMYQGSEVRTRLVKQHDFDASPSPVLTLGHFGAANGGQSNVGPFRSRREDRGGIIDRNFLLAGRL
jgi:hypothetical protein